MNIYHDSEVVAQGFEALRTNIKATWAARISEHQLELLAALEAVCVPYIEHHQDEYPAGSYDGEADPDVILAAIEGLRA